MPLISWVPDGGWTTGPTNTPVTTAAIGLSKTDALAAADQSAGRATQLQRVARTVAHMPQRRMRVPSTRRIIW
jgi:hypothetical protein